MAARKAASTWLVESKYGSLPPVPVSPLALPSSLSARAIESNRLGFALSLSYVALALSWAAFQAGSLGSREAAPLGRFFGE